MKASICRFNVFLAEIDFEMSLSKFVASGHCINDVAYSSWH